MITEQQFNNIVKELIAFVLSFEADSYEEYLAEFSEISPENYYNFDVYSREDIQHIYAYALRARDYLEEL